MAIKKDDPKIALMNLYLMSRRFIKFCKNIDSDKIMKNLLMITLKERPKTIRELSDMFDVKHSLMSAIIGDMERKGLISKGKISDPRYKLIALTPMGLMNEKRAEREIEEYCERTFFSLTPKELEQIEKIAPKVQVNHRSVVYKN